MNAKTKKMLDTIAVFTILAILGLATFASAESRSNSENPSGKIRIGSNVDFKLYPEKQVSENGFAPYNVDVVNDAETTRKFELTFQSLSFQSSGDDPNKQGYNPMEYTEEKGILTGSFETKEFSLQPDESITTMLNVKVIDVNAFKGERGFIATLWEIKDGQSIPIAEREGVLVIPGPTESTKLKVIENVKVYLSPEKQKSVDGPASYEVTITNAYPYSLTLKLGLRSEQGLKAQFSESEITLSQGEKKSVKLSLQAPDKGTYVFQVVASSERQEEAYANGLLIVGETPEYSQVEQYFNGEGFAIDETTGFLVRMHLKKDDSNLNKVKGAITGKFTARNQPYKVQGIVFETALGENKISATLFTPNEEERGHIEGTLKNYGEFALFQGTLVLDGNDYQLTLTSKQNAFVETEISKDSKTSSSQIETTTEIDKVISVKKRPSETKEGKIVAESKIYILPTEITDDKFLGIIPTGKKSVVVEIIEGEQVVKKKIKEYGNTKVGDYEISVGSLQDKESIQVGIKKLQ